MGDFNCHHPPGTQKVLPTPTWRRYLTGSSDLLPLNNRYTFTLFHRSIGSRSSHDISFAPSFFALSCSWEVLQDLGSDHLPILLFAPFAPTSVLLPSIFRKLAGMTLTPTVLLQRNTRLFPLLLLCLPLWH